MQAKDWNLPMVDVTGRKYEVTIQSVSLLNAVLSMHYRQPYADPVIDGMGFTDQERAVIDHSKYVKDMREESLNLALKTMNQAYWQRSQEKSRRLYLELQISQGEISKHWYNNDFRCGGCETIIPAKQSHLWSLGGHFCNYHCLGNKLIKDRAESNGH